MRRLLALLEPLAVRQFGVFSIAQAAESEVPPYVVSRLAGADGPIERVHPTVYRLRSAPADWRAPIMAAALHAGPGAVACRRSAALLLGLDGVYRHDEVDIWHPSGLRPDGYCHSRAVVHPSAIVDVGPLMVTDAATTLAQLGAVTDVLHVERAMESAVRRGLTTPEVLTARLGCQGSTGLGKLRQVLARRPLDLLPTHSELETRFWQLVRQSTTIDPMPVRQLPVVVDGRVLFFLDLCWPTLRIYVELDGLASHDHPSAILYDRFRQNEITARLGYLPLRYTWDDVVKHPRATLRQVECAWIEARSRSVAA